VKKITINESGQDQDGNAYDPKSDLFNANGILISHSPIRLSNSVTYSAYFFTTNLNEIVTPASPLALTLGPGPENALVLRFIGTVTVLYSAEVAMQYVSGAITYNLDFHAGYALSQ
jgi:hypothetical protein